MSGLRRAGSHQTRRRMAGSIGAPSIQRILAGIPLAWSIDASDPGNTIVGGNSLLIAKDLSGNGRDFSRVNVNPIYSASGGPNGNAYWQNVAASSNYMQLTGFAQPAPGTAPYFYYGITRVDAFNATGGLIAQGSFSRGVLECTTVTNMRANNGSASGNVAFTVGAWVRVWAQFANSTSADNFKIGASALGVGASFGNAVGAGIVFIGVDTQFLSSSHALWFQALGIPSGAQISALDAMFLARFGASVAF